MKSYKDLYTLSLADYFKKGKGTLHFAAHSHHPWPDSTFDAHKNYWLDSAKMLDQKWTKVLGEEIPKLQKNIVGTLGLSKSEQIVFAPNTHEFVNRIFSCFDSQKKIKVLTTDSEFHSFRRQLVRMKEAGLVEVEEVAVAAPNYEQVWIEKATHESWDIIFTSHIFFNSGVTCAKLSDWVLKVHSQSLIVIDGYHSFFALPIDLKPFGERIFFLAGGYKYAQSGEGVCFMSVPPNNLRPINTGWFASFETLNQKQTNTTQYSKNGMQFAGSTFDASGCYRMNAVYKMYEANNLTVERVHTRVEELKSYFLKKIGELNLLDIKIDNFIGQGAVEAHFLTCKTDQAMSIQKLLDENNIIIDARSDRLRFGFGLYHDLEDIDLLVERLKKVLQ